MGFFYKFTVIIISEIKEGGNIMKKILSIILCIASICGLTSAVYAENSKFTDVAQDSWYYEDVMNAVELGIINGKSETTFAPNDNLTYAEAIKLAACMHQLNKDGVITLTGGNPWYQTYVDYCKDNGIISKNYNYGDYATRAGYVEIFANTLPDESLKPINDVPDNSIPDVPLTNNYSQGVYKLYRAGVLTGSDTEHKFYPISTIKRCEVAAIISRMMDESKRKTFVIFENSLSNNYTIDDGDISINNQATTVVVNTAETDIEVGESPTLPGTQIGDITVEVVPSIKYEVGENGYLLDETKSPLAIEKQPEGLEAEEYGIKAELSVDVSGGKAPYSYQWFYYTGYRNDTKELENGDYVKDVTSDTLIISIENENTLLGRNIYCVITDAEGTTVKTNRVKVYGPFSMKIESVLPVPGMGVTLTGQVMDGTLCAGDRISIKQGEDIVCDGYIQKIEMFNKSLDEAIKGDTVSVLFDSAYGDLAAEFIGFGDIAIKFKNSEPDVIIN